MPVVSIIIPVYNSEKYLKRCMDSILGQTYKDIEIILIDDGSTDNSALICKEYQKKDCRITFVSQENQGVGATRNTGISMSTGEYLLFCDSDDEISSDYVYGLLRQIVENHADLSVCPFVRVTNSNRFSVELLKSFCIDLSSATEENKVNLFDLARLYLIYGPCNKIFKSSIIKENSLEFPTDTSFGEDLLFVFSYLKYCKRVSYEPNPFYLYYKNENSLLSKYRPDRFANGLRINNCVVDFFNEVRLNSHNMQKEWANRIMQEAIGSIGDLFDDRCKLTQLEKIKAIQRIVCDESTSRAVKEADWNMFNRKYMILIQHRLFHIIYLRKILAKVKRSITEKS